MAACNGGTRTVQSIIWLKTPNIIYYKNKLKPLPTKLTKKTVFEILLTFVQTILAL